MICAGMLLAVSAYAGGDGTVEPPDDPAPAQDSGQSQDSSATMEAILAILAAMAATP